jgi:hypothetical protein
MAKAIIRETNAKTETTQAKLQETDLMNAKNMEKTYKNLIRGIVTNELWRKISVRVKGQREAMEVLRAILNTTRFICHEIWSNRCEKFVRWEKENGIGRKEKREKKKTKRRNNSQSVHEPENNMEKKKRKIWREVVSEWNKGKIGFFDTFNMFLTKISVSAA